MDCTIIPLSMMGIKTFLVTLQHYLNTFVVQTESIQKTKAHRKLKKKCTQDPRKKMELTDEMTLIVHWISLNIQSIQ